MNNEIKTANDEVTVLGRPVNPNSERQKRIAERKAKQEAGVAVKRGRPTVEGSERQKRLAAIEAKKAAGVEIKRGRPKMVKADEVVETPTTDATDVA
jgi:hypothetical protein